MAFNPNDRVRVTDESSVYRKRLGTVETVDADGNHVRIDGHRIGRTTLFRDAQLGTTTIEEETQF